MSTHLEFDLYLRRKDFVLNVKAEISDGITGIFGPSGHGKTSLLHAIAGIAVPDFGSVKIKGKPVFNSEQKINLATRKRNVGYVFQDIRLFPHLSIVKNLKYGCSRKSCDINFQEVVNTLKIQHLLRKKPAECSGGEKQRIAIGRAILCGAKIMLMDEPFSGIDVNLRKEIIPFLILVNKTFNIPMVIVSHDLPDLLSLTENLILINWGKIVAKGKFHNLILFEQNLKLLHESGWYNVLNLYVFAFLQSKNIIILKNATGELSLQVVYNSFQAKLELKKEVKVLIKPENIILAKQPVLNISLRNQIQGTIVKIFIKDGYAYCIINIGLNIIVEITEASQKNMNLKAGEKVFCLFKSVSLKIF